MCYWLYNRSMDATLPLARREVQGEAGARRGQQAGAEGGLRLLRRDRGLPGQLRDPAGEARPGRLPQPLGQHRARARLRGRRAEGRAAALPGQLPDHAGLRHPARALDATRSSASSPSRPRTRSPRSRPRSAPPTAARSRSPPPPGPGMALKTEAIGLAMMIELPLVIVDIQRGGPSTGLPTKTEQADLLPGALRPQLRGAGAGARGVARRATASGSRSRRAGSRSST